MTKLNTLEEKDIYFPIDIGYYKENIKGDMHHDTNNRYKFKSLYYIGLNFCRSSTTSFTAYFWYSKYCIWSFNYC